MPVSIVSNLSSQYSQQAIKERNLNVVNSTQKLSSGKRVFGASEDAAALAIGAGLKIENMTLAKARLNATGGISMLQVTDGALGQVQDIMIRLKTLATQASSGQNGPVERAAVAVEFNALREEIDRISADTEFNGVAMMNGTARYTLDEAHTLSADGISVEVDPDIIGQSDATYRVTYNSTSESMTVTKIDGAGATSQTIDLTALLDSAGGVGQNMSGSEKVEATFQTVGLKITLNSSFDRTTDKIPFVTDNTPAGITLATPTFVPATTNLTTAGLAGMGVLTTPYSGVTGDIDFTFDSVGGVVTLAGIPSLRYSVNGGAVGASGAATGDLVGASTYVDVYVDTATGYERLGRLTTAVGGVSTTADSTGTITVPLGQGLVAADYQDNFGATRLTYMVGTGVIPGQDLINVDIPAVTSQAFGFDTLDVNTQAGADQAISTLSTALQTMASTRALVGAQQARLEQIASSIDVRTENNEMAKSALLDVDVASEITTLTNNQAMLEVGVSMLSQSNRLPEILLQMLRN